MSVTVKPNEEKAKKPLISVFHPTARTGSYPSFPRGWLHAMEAFLSNCDDPSRVEYVLSVHRSRVNDLLENCPHPPAEAIQRFWAFKVVINDGPDTNISQVNFAASCTTAPILMGVMDDLFPPQGWDTLVIQSLDGLEESDTVVQFSTGSPRDAEPLINAGALTRKRYERYGYIVHPSYESMFADNELTALAVQDGALLQRLDIQFEHRHPAFGKSDMDSVYVQENREEAYKRGRENFLKRQALGFPKFDTSRVTLARKPLIACCLPGSVYSSQWVASFMQLHMALSVKYNPVPLFGYSSNVYITRTAMAQSLRQFEPLPDFVLWIDDDNLLSYDQFEMLMKVLEDRPEANGAFGWAWIQPDVAHIDEARVSVGTFERNGACTRLSYAELMAGKEDVKEIGWGGFPACLMRYGTVGNLGADAFLPIVSDVHPWGLSSEDSSFCWRASQAGCKFFVDRRVKVPHLKLRPAEPILVAEPVESCRAVALEDK
jgi:hypothetical protein